MKKLTKNIISVVGGIAIGFINGFFGSGGGMLCVPLLEKVLGEKTKTAHASAILIILPVSLISAIVYIVSGFWDTGAVLITSGGVVAGGIIGALLLKFLPPKIIGLVFSLMMIGIGIKLLF